MFLKDPWTVRNTWWFVTSIFVFLLCRKLFYRSLSGHYYYCRLFQETGLQSPKQSKGWGDFVRIRRLINFRLTTGVHWRESVRSLVNNGEIEVCPKHFFRVQGLTVSCPLKEQVVMIKLRSVRRIEKTRSQRNKHCTFQKKKFLPKLLIKPSSYIPWILHHLRLFYYP